MIAFAEHLGLPVEAMECLQLLGVWSDTRAGSTWTWPAFDGAGNITGLWRRNADGRKGMSLGSKGGLIPNRLWEEMEGPLFIVEGTSNVCALHTLKLAAIGTHNAGFGAEMLAEMLAELGGVRELYVLANRDEKDDGTRPGLDGAQKLAGQLAGFKAESALVLLP